MKNPALRTWLLGSRFTAPPILLGAGWYTWRWWEAGGVDNTGLLSIGLSIVSLNAMRQVNAYRQWRADWQAMGPGGDKPPRFRLRPRALLGVVAALLVLGLIASVSGPNASPQANEWLGLAIMGSAALGVLLIAVRLAKRICWSRGQSKMMAVTIAIQRPVLRVPSLAECYKRLPGHCQQLLKARRS